MPQPDFPVRVINVDTGYNRENKSWMTGRLLRDQEGPLSDEVWLTVTVSEAVDAGGRAKIDWIW